MELLLNVTFCIRLPRGTQLSWLQLPSSPPGKLLATLIFFFQTRSCTSESKSVSTQKHFCKHNPEKKITPLKTSVLGKGHYLIKKRYAEKFPATLSRNDTRTWYVNLGWDWLFLKRGKEMSRIKSFQATHSSHNSEHTPPLWGTVQICAFGAGREEWQKCIWISETREKKIVSLVSKTQPLI